MRANLKGQAPAVTTAAELLTAVEPFGPCVEEKALVFATDPPVALVPAIELLHTGIRAAMSGKRWYGCGDTQKTAAPRPLAVGEPVPEGITLLAVEGDDCWDRIHAAARLDRPDLFAPMS